MTDVEDLARRAVACSGWRWMPGMRTTTGTRVLLVEDDGAYVLGIPAGWHQPILLEGQYLPDLADPATVGCLLALVRKAWGTPCGTVAIPAAGGVAQWQVVTYAHGAPAGTRSRVLGDDPTEAEALVAALEAAP